MLASLVSSLSGDGHDGWMDGWLAFLCPLQ